MRGGEVSQISAPSTQSPGYLTPNPGYLSKVEEQLRGHSKVWLYLEAERISPHEPYLAAAERAVGHCDLVKSAVNDRLYFCSAGATK